MIKTSKELTRHTGLADCDCSDCNETAQPRKRRGLQTLISALIGLVILALAANYAYAYYRTNYGTAQQKADYEIQKTVARVSKLIVLPTDETPVLATISDAASLAKQQNFFAGSTNGDKLLVYQKALKAIVWSPTSGKLVNVGPVIYDQTANKSLTPPSSAITPIMETGTTTIKTKKK